MALTMFQLRRWIKMLSGKSVWHVNQDIGKCLSKDSIRGYYNNMTEKVTMIPELLDTEELPKLKIESGEEVYFPVAIFQYGLGAYDLYLITNDDRYKRKFWQCVEWTIQNQEPNGAWNNFFYIYPEHPYGAMAQGEGASLLIRAFCQSGESRYLDAAKKAIDFMLNPIERGGTSVYENDDIILLEYTHRPAVMNGWIFAWWGLYDYVLATHDGERYKDCLDKSCKTLVANLYKFTTNYWSMYDLDGRIASPFYNNLHIAQMQAMYELTGYEVFRQYASKWRKYQQNNFCYGFAFVVKAFQKIRERE